MAGFVELGSVNGRGEGKSDAVTELLLVAQANLTRQIYKIHNKKLLTVFAPAFYLNADPDPGSQTNADPVRIRILLEILSHKKLYFYMRNNL